MKIVTHGLTLTGIALATGLATAPSMVNAAESRWSVPQIAAASSEAMELRLEAQHLVDRARLAVSSFASDSTYAALPDYLKSAAGVVIIPELVRGGIGIGGEGGAGVVLRHDKQTNGWSEPAFVTFGGVSLGPQLGVETAEVIAVIMSEETLNRVVAGEIGLGADAKAVAGRQAARAEAAGTVTRGDIHVFTRSQGAFLGAAVKGGFLDSDDRRNQAYYARTVSPGYIFGSEAVMNPGSKPLTAELKALSSGTAQLGDRDR